MPYEKDLDVLILTASYGGGHTQAAKALAESLGLLKSNLNIEILDYVNWVNTGIDYLTKKAYVEMTSKAPYLWHLLYDITDNPVLAKGALFKRLGYKRFYQYLKIRNPKIIISTHFLTSAVVGHMKKKGWITTPVVSVITDNILHSFWINKYVDYYIVGNEKVKEDLRHYDIPKQNIFSTGIPISPKFNLVLSKNEIMKKYNLDPNKVTVLIMSGAYSMGDIKGICSFLAEYEADLQLLIVCGRDNKLKRAITKITANSKNTARVFGFVDNVHELMTISDLLISKSGGLTTSEAMATNTPMIVYRPIPGQEDGNAKFLEEAGAAVLAKNSSEFVRHFDNIINNKDILDKMTKACSHISKGNSAENSVRLIINKLKLQDII